MQKYIDRGSDGAASGTGRPGLAEAIRLLGATKPVKPGSIGDRERSNAPEIAGTLVLPALTPTRQRRRVAFKVAALLSVSLHAGSLYAFLAWYEQSETGALDRPSDSISVEIVESRTLEARQPQKAAEPAPSVDATAPVEGKTEAADAQPMQPELEHAPEPEINVPQLPFAIADAQEEVMRAVKRETPADAQGPPVPEHGPAITPPPKGGTNEDDAPAKLKPRKQEEMKAADPTPKGGHISKSSAGKGKGGERVSASSGAMLSYAAEVRARVAGNKPAGDGLRGTAVVAFGLTPAGGLAFTSLARSSGDSHLDQLAVAAVRSAAPFPPPPAGATSAQLRFSIPFYFE